MRSVVALCVLALAVAVSGCAGAGSQDSAKDFKGQERAVAKTVESLETAARKRDADKVCKELLSTSLLDALKKKGTNCKTGVKEAFDDADANALDLKVDDVTIKGETATAKVISGGSGVDKKTDTLDFARESAVWKISSLGPSASR